MNFRNMMRYSGSLRLVCFCLLLFVFAGSFIAGYGYDWELEELQEEDSETNTAGRSGGSNLRFYFGLLPFWVAIAMLVAFAWNRKGYNFWTIFILSLFISPLIMLFLLRFFPEKQAKKSGEPSTLSMLALQKSYASSPVKRDFTAVKPDAEIKENPVGIINDEIEMVLISGGSYSMGRKEEDDSFTNNQVVLQSFYLSKYPVTQKLWQAVMGGNPSAFKGNNLPVESINWYEAVEFCNRLNKLLGLTEPYTVLEKSEGNSPDSSSGKIIVTANKNSDGYRLPTEAEWEFAARGGHEGEDTEFAGSNLIVQVAWFDFNSDGHTHPVGKKKANEPGLHDMSGNVWEWCWDWYHDRPVINREDHSRKESTKGKVIRGGSWDYAAYRCRVDHRFFRPANSLSNDMGFRLARNYKG